MSKTNSKKNSRLRAIENEIDFEKEIFKGITFNFRYYTHADNGGESFEEWEKEKILSELNNKLYNFSSKTKAELIVDKTLEIYHSFPKDSGFSVPQALKEHNIEWARLRLTGRRRLIGVFFSNANRLSENDVFYIVFLDKEHAFAPCKK